MGGEAVCGTGAGGGGENGGEVYKKRMREGKMERLEIYTRSFSFRFPPLLLFLKVRKRESGEVYYKRKRKGEEKRKGLEIYKILPLFLLFFLFMEAKIIRK